jgi:hypothetical protein
MTRTKLAQGTMTFAAVIVAGFVSTAQLDRHFAAAEAGKKATSDNKTETPAPATSSAACVGKDGSWKNWPWSNVPALSPKCPDDR